MGVDRTSYLLYGFKVNDEKKMQSFDNHYEELMEEEPYSNIFNNSNSEVRIIYDYMCGEYVYVGVILGEIEEYDDNETIEISKEDIDNLNEKLMTSMDTWPKYLIKLFKKQIPKLYFFVHAY